MIVVPYTRVSWLAIIPCINNTSSKNFNAFLTNVKLKSGGVNDI